MSVSKTQPAPAPRGSAQSAIEIAVTALHTDAANRGLTRENYNLVASGNEVQVWIPGGAGYAATKTTFIEIFKAAGFKEAQGEDRYTHQPKKYYVDSNRISYDFQVDEQGGAPQLNSGGGFSAL